MSKTNFLERIEKKILSAAEAAFDPEEEEIGSDGFDQGVREGLLKALDIVEREYARI